jgi:RHH-type proline utilization regulon transcriptional repressor/proline dehydrogenase/delta 1-pyrroline-5-carboxylate dehydrogenase
VAVRVERDAARVEVRRVLEAARRCGVDVVVSDAGEETAEAFADRLGDLDVQRIRLVGTTPAVVRDAAVSADLHVADDAVTSDGRIELLHYVREQAVSRTLHRYGNLLARDPRRHERQGAERTSGATARQPASTSS